MTWILHYCVVGWLGACNTIYVTEWPTEKSCDKAMAILERQAKEQNVKYRVICKPKSADKEGV